jgi:hypothetical protein
MNQPNHPLPAARYPTYLLDYPTTLCLPSHHPAPFLIDGVNPVTNNKSQPFRHISRPPVHIFTPSHLHRHPISLIEEQNNNAELKNLNQQFLRFSLRLRVLCVKSQNYFSRPIYFFRSMSLPQHRSCSGAGVCLSIKRRAICLSYQ